MLRVGLTGGAGSGKSTVARILQSLGAQISQSDEIARALMQPGQHVFHAIVQTFGHAVFTASGQLDRAMLAHLAFECGRLEELNAIVHPAVISAQNAWMAEVGRTQPSAVAVVESALIFETLHSSDGSSAPWRSRFDRIVVATAPEPLRRERYIARLTEHAHNSDRQAAAADFQRRTAVQWTDERKAEVSDFVLPNDGSLEQLRADVERLYAKLRQEATDLEDEAM